MMQEKKKKKKKDRHHQTVGSEAEADEAEEEEEVEEAVEAVEEEEEEEEEEDWAAALAEGPDDKDGAEQRGGGGGHGSTGRGGGRGAWRGSGGGRGTSAAGETGSGQYGSGRAAESADWRRSSRNGGDLAAAAAAQGASSAPAPPPPPPAAVADFSSLTFVSRRLGPGSDEFDDNSLKNRRIQEAYFAHIVGRVEKYRRDRAAAKAEPGPHDMDPILANFRKLREGLVAAAVYDAFAVSVYEKSAEVCLEAGHDAELLKSLVGLVRVVYPGTSAAGADDQYPRRAEFTSLYMLYFICNSPTTTAASASGAATAAAGAQSASTRRTAGGLSMHSLLRLYCVLPAAVRTSDAVAAAMRLQRALLADLDFVAFGRIWRRADAQARKIVEPILPWVRQRTWTLLQKAYFTFPAAELRGLLLFDVGDDNGDGAAGDAAWSAFLAKRVPGAEWADGSGGSGGVVVRLRASRPAPAKKNEGGS
ncbi:hypothetical protein DFJ73DRAFT_960637 [Zopfochytrium polystomum]|nr:hypothetical protein DFJ73DRAFT_960637 [Zopfochytrium polystomum]